MASKTRGSTGVVAALSRYTGACSGISSVLKILVPFQRDLPNAGVAEIHQRHGRSALAREWQTGGADIHKIPSAVFDVLRCAGLQLRRCVQSRFPPHARVVAMAESPHRRVGAFDFGPGLEKA